MSNITDCMEQPATGDYQDTAGTSEMTVNVGEEGHAGKTCTEINFMDFPGEIRNRIYDLITYERLQDDLKDHLKLKGPLPVLMSRDLLALRFVNNQFGREVLDRFFTWGSTLRLNMIMQLAKTVTVRYDSLHVRKNLRGTCPTGTWDVVHDMGFRMPQYRPLTDEIPPIFTKAWKVCHFELQFRCCRGMERCRPCKSYKWEKVEFDILPTLNHLFGFYTFRLPGLPLLEVAITQSENWLSFGGQKLRQPGELEDLVALSEGGDGNALEWHLRTAWPGVKFKVVIKTRTNPGKEYFEI